jgi:glycosyltransferase involved in cell wall biosynthesis
VLDFHRELLPELKQNADLFLCCHRQGDPSCTYLETLGCGVPVVGYDNEALSGILSLAEVGGRSDLDRPDRLAEIVAGLARDRERLAWLSRRALAFARGHSFEETVERRIHHLERIAERGFERRRAVLGRLRGTVRALDDTLAAREVFADLIPRWR